MNKSGRKGDPRMHRAVAARLADPALTLFEALRAGGFDYAVDDDATAIDRESVTLGQRKNQLSRRLRLAKRGEHEYHPGGGDTGSVGPTSGGGSAGGSTCHGGGGEGRGKKRSSGNGGSSRHHNHHHRQYSHPTHNPGLLDDIDDSEFQPSAPEPAPARIKAKHHPDYRGPIIVLPRSGLRQQQTNTAAAAQQQQQQQQPPAPMEDGRRVASKSPAAYQRAAPDPQNNNGGGALNAPSPNPQLLLGQQSQYLAPFPFLPYAQLNQYASLCGLPPLTALPPAAAAAATIPLPGMSPAAPLPSGVAVASLNSTAQRIGMTLEQLALALSQCSSLSKVLTAIATESGDHVERHKILAQNLCLTDLKGLYSRSMLLAGFNMDQAAEDSPKCLEFAVTVWQLEGKRLGALLRAKNMSNLLGDALLGGSTTNPADQSLTGRTAVPALRYGSSQGSDNSDDDDDRGGGQEDDEDEDDDEDHDPMGAEIAMDDPSGDRKQPAELSPGGGTALSHVYGHARDAPHRHHSHRTHLSPRIARPRSGSHACVDGRHVHRLEGCGHKAILHQPENGPAHIDFLVGDKIECYQGLPGGVSLSPAENPNSLSAWLSQFKGDDASMGGGGMNASQSDDASMNLPKILDVSTLDLDGKEWITAVDETLLSLCKLSDPAPGDEKEER